MNILSATTAAAKCETPVCDKPTLDIAVLPSAPSVFQVTSKLNNLCKLNFSIPYILCAARFAHYIRVILRNKIGGFNSNEECETYLQNWLLQYCATSKNVGAKGVSDIYPLCRAKVSIPLSQKKLFFVPYNYNRITNLQQMKN